MKFVIALFMVLKLTFVFADCSKPETTVRKIMCFSSRAMQSQENMAFAFHSALRRGVSPDLLRQTQESWKRQTRDICITVECIVEAHKKRIVDLSELPIEKKYIK